MDLLFTNMEALVGDVVINGCPSYSDHKIMIFKILRGLRKDSIRSWTSAEQILDYSETGRWYSMGRGSEWQKSSRKLVSL